MARTVENPFPRFFCSMWQLPLLLNQRQGRTRQPVLHPDYTGMQRHLKDVAVLAFYNAAEFEICLFPFDPMLEAIERRHSVLFRQLLGQPQRLALLLPSLPQLLTSVRNQEPD